MQDHFLLDDEAFVQQFRAGTLPPALFSHEAHLRLAWLYLERYGSTDAVERVCADLLRYVAVLGAEDKFNKTLTVAAVKAVDHFRQKSASDAFPGFIEEFPRLKYHFKELLASHYRRDIFTSAEAKREFVEPDLLPF